MTLSNVHTHSPFDIPPAQCPVDPGTHQDIALRTPGNGEDMTGMSHQGTEQVSTRRLPHLWYVPVMFAGGCHPRLATVARFGRRYTSPAVSHQDSNSPH